MPTKKPLRKSESETAFATDSTFVGLSCSSSSVIVITGDIIHGLDTN